MKIYEIEVEEFSRKLYTVKAKDEREAIKKASKGKFSMAHTYSKVIQLTSVPKEVTND